VVEVDVVLDAAVVSVVEVPVVVVSAPATVPSPPAPVELA